MAEAAGPMKPSPVRIPRRNKPRRPQIKSQSGENAASKIELKKRPPRLPKLPDGSVLVVPPRPSARPAVQPPAAPVDVPPVADLSEQYYVINQKFEETGEKFAMLSLGQEQSKEQQLAALNVSQESFEDPSVSESSSKSKEVEDCENVISNEEVNASVSKCVKDRSKKKEEVVKNHFLLQNLYRDRNKKPLRSQRDESKDDSQPGASKKNNNCSSTPKESKDKKKEKKIFNEHLPLEVIKELVQVQDPQNPNIVEGNIRINPRCYQNAYISLTNGDQDILIIGLKDRNRALEGDLVAVVINARDKWFKVGENAFQKTGRVVSILEKFHPRKAVGFLKKQDVFVFFQPRDCRVPIMKINPRTIPQRFYDDPYLFENTLFFCHIIDWKNVAFAEGEVEKVVGNKENLADETWAILLENNLSPQPFLEDQLHGLPPVDYVPTEADLMERDDLRKTCIFTIDPATAVDLDDAMSCKPLENGNFEIGVHISDVTHYLKAFSELDRVVAERATTVYMVDNVYHMLPKELCMVCSLLPGQDKLAFSVILEVTPDGDIVKHRFCKSVINSCCQMSYEQAQIMIDHEDYDWEANGSLKIHGDYTPADLAVVVKNLFEISRHLKQKRFDNGALKIDQPKLRIILDEKGVPASYELEEKRQSNSLIEEFMLLANMTVAEHLYKTLPEVSLLRSHDQPNQRMLKKTQELLTKFGVILDIESAGTLHNSLLSWHEAANVANGLNGLDIAQYRWMVINNLCAKSMLRATYRCSAGVKSQKELKHYALNTEFYTHFTSPIRRYPDCIVHRLLYASITNEPLPEEWNTAVCQSIAKNCNTKKFAAKEAQEQSNALYFAYLLDIQGSMNVLAIVMDIKERSVDTMLCDTGLKVRLYFDDTLEKTTTAFSLDNEVPSVKLTWKKRNIVQDINIFSILNVKITKHAQLFKLQGIILPPVQME